jgi:hypothetical protein
MSAHGRTMLSLELRAVLNLNDLIILFIDNLILQLYNKNVKLFVSFFVMLTKYKKKWKNLNKEKFKNYSSSIDGSQKARLVHADTIIMYLGLNWTHCTGLGWSPFSTHTLNPVSAFHTCTRPSELPAKINCESGLNDASIGIPLLFKCP